MSPRMPDTRRWQANQSFTVSCIRFRVRHGSKSFDDLRLDAMCPGGDWRPVDMELAFFLVDFFADNEDRLRFHRSFWRENGQRYFLAKCAQAIRDGWVSVADEIRKQRGA